MRNTLNNVRPNILANGTPLFCDLYHLTMAQAWVLDGKADEIKTSEAFFRRCPFGGSYLMAAGLGEFAQWLNNWHFSNEDIDYLRSLKNPDGSRKFKDEFLNFIKDKKLDVTIKAVPEGEIVFPNEPVYSVTGPCWQVDIIEAALLNIFNSQSLIATKATRMVRASQIDGVKRPLLEFGLRRCQELGAFSQTRASYIGGATGTSNVAAAQYYGIPASGTMAHSFIMSYENELDAFKAYMRNSEGNTTLLVDTYDTRQGIKNAIRASEETGIKLMGMRIDSGDLAYWAKEAKLLLNDAMKNMENPELISDAKLVASNDLDEYCISNLKSSGSPINSWGVGTKLITSSDSPSLGGVYKLVASYKDGKYEPKIKISEDPEKITNPGYKKVVRIYNTQGHAEADLIMLEDESIDTTKPLTIFHPVYKWKTKTFTNYTIKELLKPLYINGECKYEKKSVIEIQEYTRNELNTLWREYKRLLYPQTYKVDLSEKLCTLKESMLDSNKSI